MFIPNIDFKKYPIIFMTILCCLLFFILTGCSSIQESTINNQNDNTVAKPIDNPAQPLLNPISEKNDKDKGKIDINSFRPIKDCFIKYEFDIVRSGTKERPNSFAVQGKYDLNQDGRMDSISLLLQGDYGNESGIQPYIKVNDIKQEFYMDYTLDGEVRIIDLDFNDKFLEVAYFDEGPSGDPHYDIYRYDGLKLYEIGSVDANAIMDGQGRLISSFVLSRFKPFFCSAWAEIEDNKLVLKENNIQEYLGKNYKFDGGEAYFIPAEEMPEKLEVIWDNLRQFEPSEVKILDIYFYPGDRTLNYYFVEFPNSEKGMLYFWIGD